MNLRTTLASAALLLASSAGAAWAWDTIGTREVRDRTDRDVIVVEGPRRFERIKLCVERNPVHFIDVDVIFANGGHQDVSVRQRINPGECTRNIDLNGGARNIARVSLLYEETSYQARTATVRLLAE